MSYPGSPPKEQQDKLASTPASLKPVIPAAVVGFHMADSRENDLRSANILEMPLNSSCFSISSQSSQMFSHGKAQPAPGLDVNW